MSHFCHLYFNVFFRAKQLFIFLHYLVPLELLAFLIHNLYNGQQPELLVLVVLR